MLFKRRADYFIILYEPELFLRIPPSACCFRLEPYRHVGNFDVSVSKSFLFNVDFDSYKNLV